MVPKKRKSGGQDGSSAKALKSAETTATADEKFEWVRKLTKWLLGLISIKYNNG